MSDPMTKLHYTANTNIVGNIYQPGSIGFNLADVSSVAEVDALPIGVKALVYLGYTAGADATFQSLVAPFIGDPNVYGFYLADEPYSTDVNAANLKAESDYIHTHVPGTKTFIVLVNEWDDINPVFKFNPANTGVDLFGVDPYPVQTQYGGANYSIINTAVKAAVAQGIPINQIVPVYQAFGGGGYDSWIVPTANQEQAILSTWGSLVPTPAFDYVYSWGIQNGDTALSDTPALQQVFAAHNALSSGSTGALAGKVQLSKATEGTALASATTVASFTDTNAADTAAGFAAVVNWGDGATFAGTVTGASGSFTVAAGHTYADEGSFPLSATITRTADKAAITPTGTVVAANADVLTPHAVTIIGTANQVLNNATVATFTDSYTANVAGDFTASINWGDGTTSVGAVGGSNGTFTVTGSHTFAATGTTPVVVTLTEDPPGTATATTGTPSPLTTGSGSDALVLTMSEDAYQGDAKFTAAVDGKQLAGTFTATAPHATGAGQSFTFKGDWAVGAHTLAVNFLNDAYAGTTATDRNLYVNAVSYNGTTTGQSAALMSTGPKSFGETDATAIPSPATGSGADTLVLSVSEDAYLGNAQFTVAVDGKQLGGTFTATALHATGASQPFTFKGDFGAVQHAVAVKFLNDAYAGTAATDRNLYVNAVSYNGTNTNQSGALMSTGAKTFAVTGGTTPAVTETGDHGSLQKSLSQTGTYTVGGDTFVLSTGNAATVTLGTGTSQIKFIGPSAVTLTGGSGQAVVTADAGSNRFVAGTGSLDVTGGGGKDGYVFHANSGLLTLQDFSLAKGDTLTVDKALQGSLQQASDGQGGTMLTFGTAGHGVGVHGIATLPSANILWV
jgi:hypothetical protein